VILKNRIEIERFLKAPGASFRAALIHGRDAGVVRERGHALAAEVTARPDDPFDVALFAEADLEKDPGRLEDELMAISMMGGRRLVRVKLSGDRGEPVRIVGEAMGEHLAGRCNPDAFLIVEAGVLPKESTLLKIGGKAPGCAVIACYEDEPGELKLMVRQALAAEGLGLNGEALELFVMRLPHDRGVARAEIERLALFLGPGSGRVGGAGELEAFLGVEPEASLAQAAADAFGGRLAAAQAGLRRAAMEMDAGPAAVRAIGLHLARLRRVLTNLGAGADLQAAVRAAGVFWKDEREFLRHARAWTLAGLDRLQPEVLAADRACKRTGAPAALLAERLVLSVAARAQRLGL